MAELLYKLGRWCFHRGWWVILTWVLILGAAGSSAFILSKPFSTQFNISDTPSIQATKLLVQNFPDQGNPVDAASINLVFQAPPGRTLEDPILNTAIDAVIHKIETNLAGELTGLDRFGNPVQLSGKLQEVVINTYLEQGLPLATAKADAANLALLSTDKTIGFTTFNLDVRSSTDVTPAQRAAINEALNLGREAGLIVEAGGPGFGDPIAIKPTSEVVGLSVAFIVLLFTFGSLMAAGMPLITAVIGVGLGVCAIMVTTYFMPLNNVTPTLAVMIGLAVGIDYALFILARYRTELGRLGPREAAGMAVGTAGSAVVFAGATVIIALAALTVAGIEFLSAMGLLAAATVFMAVLVALTLVPALLGVVGKKAFAGRIPKVGNPDPQRTIGRAWVRFVHRVPGLVLAVVILGLGALSYPVTRLEMTLPSDSTSNVDTTQRKSADLLAAGFGPGINAPFLLVVDAHEVNPESTALSPLIAAQGGGEAAARLASFLYTVDHIDGMAGVKNAQIAGINKDSTAAQILVTPYTGPATQETVHLAHALRARAAEIAQITGAKVGLTGLTAVQMDITEKLAAAMPLYLGIVVGLAIILLLLIFRSVMVPVVAGLGFLLSVGAAFGITVLVWQEGLWGMVNTPAPLISFMPIFLIGVTFGLAMDYQVFLVSSMREYFTHHDGESSTRYTGVEESVVEGFSQSARVVTAAALIMISVFAAFIDQPLPFIQIFGFALGAGVLFDAFFIRMGLIPAAMFLMGRATWWIPCWLDKILPHLDVEGAALEKKFADGTLIGITAAPGAPAAATAAPAAPTAGGPAS
ncbi:MMPL family transporter [Corynebacterium caspium]|uniref:MMPL family transporter n=1 Tax=Corynebacterium caspium TaxID=234828 RepID=UPI000369E281|nr:MMPL family transporter [Corynebacterium caspium]WKD58530.1 Membrane protein YdfJ [Corynebacterium caspium DSM 44850]